MDSRASHTSTGTGSHGGFDPMRFKIRTQKNNEQMIAFIISMVALLSAIISFHWARAIGAPSKQGSSLAYVPSWVTRQIRRLLLQPMPVLPSVGHGTLVSVYFTVNICIAFTNTDPALTALSNLGSRMGWMTVANLVVVVLLSVKNTPLAFLTPWSYERLNILHQIAGCTTVICVILHACLYTVNFTSQGRPERLLETNEIFGMVAGLSFLILGFAGVVLRRWWYEAFYYVHITFWLLALVMTGLHQPELAKNVVYVVGVIGGLWLLDRTIRFARLAAYSTNNHITLTPLSNGATRVVMNKAPVGTRPGKHCFLWIPRIRPTEAHPFTIVGTQPLEFVVMSYDGFTSALHKHANKYPGAKLRASVDGPYGTFPDASKYDKVVLVAGGSGVTFTIGVAIDMLKKVAASDAKEVVFIWIAKQKDSFTWFAEQLNMLQADRRFKVLLYVTREKIEQVNMPPSRTLSAASSVPKSLEQDPEKNLGEASRRPPIHRSRTLSSGKGSLSESDLASPVDEVISDIHNLSINYERPKAAELVEMALMDVPSDRRVCVMVCGPPSLSSPVRNTTAARVRPNGPRIELHCEQFGW